MYSLRSSNGHVLVAVLVVLFALRATAENENHTMGKYVGIDENSLENLSRLTTLYASLMNGRAVGEVEVWTLGTSFIDSHTRHRRFTDGHAVFDRKLSHFIAFGIQLETPGQRSEHIRSCPVCHGLLISFLRGTSVSPEPLMLAFKRVSIARPTGGRLRLNVDREGYLYAVDSHTNQPDPIPVSQLVRIESDWYATDGFHWEGPLIPSPAN